MSFEGELIFEAERRMLTPREFKTVQREMRAKMTPRGKMALPKFLDKRRWDFCIPDEAFKLQASFDRVIVFQLDPDGDDLGETATPGGVIIKPKSVRDNERISAPRGVIVAAGLEALDNLRSNGIDLGHIILFTKYSPYRIRIPYFNGKQLDLLMLRDGDICGSEDTRKAILEGKMKIEWRDQRETDAHGNEIVVKRHYYMVKKGKGWEVWNPTMPWIPEDN